MKKLILTFFSINLFVILFAQNVPVTFHFKPEYTQFQILRLVGTFNGWNNADPAMVMSDPGNTGEYSITINLAPNVDHNYKFVMDADWGFAYSDPDNPRINLSDNNNSILTVKDPMITYLLPRDINSNNNEFVDATQDGLPIRAIFAFTQANPIDPSKITVKIDGTNLVNPSQYYDAVKRELLYQPSPALSKGEHTVTVSITSAVGTDEKSTTFKRDPSFIVYKVPTDFYFDQYNSSVNFTQAVNDAALVGVFNNWNDAMNPMLDSDGDGLWETTVSMEPGMQEYKFKLNKIFWTNDPDEPAVGATADQNSVITVKADSIPHIKLLQPAECTVYTQNPSNITFKALLRPGSKSLGVDESTIMTKLDGTVVQHSLDNSSLTLTVNTSLNGEGKHTIFVSFTNKEGLSESKTYSYGIYTQSKGKYVVDAVNDEPYSYPSGVADGSADILAVKITEVPTHDSLRFVIQLRKITDRTRVGIIISDTNPDLINDPLNLDIKTIDWNGHGIFASIGTPGNQYENANAENRIMLNSNPVTYSNIYLNVNDDAFSKNEFNFTIGLSFLDSTLGSWPKERQFSIFSFIASEDKSGNGYEVGSAEGASSYVEDPDIYDAAFIRSGFWQQRMMANYIPAGQTLGPRLVALDGKGRGLLPITAVEISDSLAKFGPDVTFLTPAVEYWYPNVTVHGTLSDSTITSILFNFNNAESTIPVKNGHFEVPLTLIEGNNIVFVTAEDSRGYKTVTKDLVLVYKPDNKPSVDFSSNITGRQVVLTANANSPAGYSFTYFWAADPQNPAPVPATSYTKSVTLNIPQVDGEYYFNVVVTDSKNNKVIGRALILANSDSVYIPDINYHSKWIDNAIFYEIYPRSFSQQGGFNGIAARIPDMKDLGINAVWLMPVFEGPTTHGYEITNYYALEQDYGTETDFKNMLAAFKANGIKVILDYVVNHTSLQHPFMKNVFSYHEYSPWADFYIWDGEPGNSNYQYYFDWTSLPNLNHQNPDVRKYFIDVAKYWISNYSISGYRCDVAWGVEERSNLYWPEWRKELKVLKPDAFLEAEATSIDSTFFQGRFDSANDWELRNKLIGVLNGSNTLQDLRQEATRKYSLYARPFRFIENHDETRAAAMFDTKRSELLHTIIFTLNGVPLIYSGGEVGELTNRDMINWSDPNNIRPYFKKLVHLRSSYVHNPQIDLINNSDNNNVFSYSSISGDSVLLTIANFKNEGENINFDLSGLPVLDGASDYYLTDLINGTVYTVIPSQRSSFPISLNEYQARVFYYGLDSVFVGVNDFEENKIPSSYKLFQNYPNPFNPVSKIKFQIKETNRVTLKIFDMLGKEVQTLIDEVKTPGVYETEFNGSNLSSGIYFYQLSAGKFLETKKLVLLK